MLLIPVGMETDIKKNIFPSIVMLTSSLECLLLAAMVGAQRRLAKNAKRRQSSA